MRSKGVHRNLGDPEHFTMKTEIGEANSPESGNDRADGVLEVELVHIRGDVMRVCHEPAEEAALGGTDRDRKCRREMLSIRRDGAATETKLKHIASESSLQVHIIGKPAERGVSCE